METREPGCSQTKKTATSGLIGDGTLLLPAFQVTTEKGTVEYSLNPRRTT